MRLIPLLVLAALCQGRVALADWPDPSVTDPAVQRQADEMARGFQGAYLVAQGDRVLATRGLGKANRVSGEDNGLTTSFRLASVSKPLTAVAVLQLVDRGLVRLDDTVSRHVPDYGANGARIKVEHLLTHSSGIPDYIGFVRNPRTAGEVIASFKDRPLQFTPGSRFQYSNSNYALLGYILEQVTGQPYDEYMQEHVFAPARMDNAGFHFPSRPGPGFAAPSGGNPEGPFEPNMKAYAAGALYASVADMLSFNHALETGLLLRPETVRAMQTARIGGYGYGLRASGGFVSHDGLIPGFTSMYVAHPATRGVVIVLSNGSTSAPSLANRLKTLLRTSAPGL